MGRIRKIETHSRTLPHIWDPRDGVPVTNEPWSHDCVELTHVGK